MAVNFTKTGQFQVGVKKKKSLTTITIFLLFLAFSASGQESIHDPSTIVKGDDDRYHVFSTGDGLYHLSASDADFDNWREEPSPLDANNYPSWIDNYVSDFEGNFWAPDLIYMDGYYYVYYSASSFGTSNSAIGVTRTPSLSNPQWEDQGVVVFSEGGRDEINAIDPAVFEDTDGKIWMSYGSYHGGIGVIEIDPSTGKTTGDLNHIAGGDFQNYEAPYIIKHDGYYYLFVNRGTCCNGIESTYYVEVSRSENIKGPYSGVREFLPEQTGNIIGPGHVGYGESILSYHYYDGFSNGFPRMITTTLEFKNGWPVAGPNGVKLANIEGTYALIAEHSDKAIGLEGQTAENQTNVEQQTYNEGNAQRFLISPAEDHWHNINPVLNEDKALDVFEYSIENGANITLWDDLNGANQHFCFQETANGNYRIINRNSNRCLDVADASQADGANIIQWGCFENAPPQTFRLVDVSTSIHGDAVDEDNVEIYPNPSAGRFVVSIPGNQGNATILNMNGDVLFETTLESTVNLIEAELKPGIYLLHVTLENNTVTKRLSIK